MIGYIYACCTLACWTLAVRNFAVASSIFKPALVNKFRLCLAFLVLYILLITYFKQTPLEVFTGISIIQWLWFGLSGVVGLAIGDYFAFTAFASIGATRTSLLSTFAPAAALVAGMLLIDESINLIGLIGIAVTIGAVIFTVLSKKQSNNSESNKKLVTFGIIAGILAAATQGIGLVLTKLGFQPMNKLSIKLEQWLGFSETWHHIPAREIIVSPVHATFVRLLIGFCVIFIIDLFRKKDFNFVTPFIRNKNGTIYVLIGTLFGPILGVSFSIATISHLEVSIAQTIFSLLPVTVMIYGMLFKKEKINMGSWFAAMIAIGGVMLIIWREKF